MGRTWLIRGLLALARRIGLVAKNRTAVPPEVEERIASAIPQAGLTHPEERVLMLRYGRQSDPSLELGSKWDQHGNADLTFAEAQLRKMEADLLRKKKPRRKRDGVLHDKPGRKYRPGRDKKLRPRR